MPISTQSRNYNVRVFNFCFSFFLPCAGAVHVDGLEAGVEVGQTTADADVDGTDGRFAGPGAGAGLLFGPPEL